MNPDKLFDYLDGRLLAGERAELEARLLSDVQLQRELAVARRIHEGMRGESREILLPETGDAARGRKMAMRVGVAFIVLMAVNVAVGLLIILRHESSNPNRELLTAQTRAQITKSLEHAAATTLTPAASLGIDEITITASAGKLGAIADEIVAVSQRLGGSATKGIPDAHRLGVLVDLPANRENEFRAALASIGGGATTLSSPNETTGQSLEKKSFSVQIVEQTATQK